MIRLLLSIEFESADCEQSRVFWTEMRLRGWLPFRSRPNMICTEVPAGLSDVDVLSMSEAEIHDAAAEAGISDWDCICILEDGEAA